jgi:N-acetyl-gamma-glutamyl-phosphate reductase
LSARLKDGQEMVRIGIIGARGFTGGELLRLGLRHPGFRITYVTSESQAGQPVTEGFPGLLGQTELRYSAFNEQEALADADAFFFALPDGEAMARVEPLLAAGRKVVDISGDFRVRDAQNYERWYGRKHLSPPLLERAAYGLPELNPGVREASLVANPGCYPSAILLAVAPLFRAGLAEPDSLIADAKSGVSGAGGRGSLDPAFSFGAISDNFRAYSVTGHRHIAEMEQELGRIARSSVTMSFTPHLLPLMRGILATCYVRLKQPGSTADLTALYQEAYTGAPFVHVLAERLPEVRFVSGSNACHVAVRYEERTQRAICISAIDNLVKGAAGSAIQNMNLICGLPETSGLELAATGP